jgi:hypothetical protein
MNIRDIGSIAKKWSDVTSTKAQYYQAGVQSPKNDWATNTAGAADAYNQGVQAAISRNAFAQGVTRAGTGKWKTNTLNLGVQRWPSGVQNGMTAYQAGFGPYLDVLKGITLPPRGAKGSPQNLNRSAVVANALHMAKVG